MKALKGEHGYINQRKKKQLIKTLIMFFIAASIFVLGLALNKWEKANVFTIIAALFVLPSTKVLVNYILLAPYHSVSDDVYQRLIKVLSEEDTMYTDMVFTSEQKVMNLAMLVIRGNQIIGLIGREKENDQYIKQYLSTRLAALGYSFQVHIVKSETEFISRVTKASRTEVTTARLTAVKEYLESLMV